LHGGQEVENKIEVPNEELQDTRTSPAAPGKTVASEERSVPDNDAPPTNPASALHNECPVQTIDDRGPAHCVVLPSKIDGVDTEGNATITGVENIDRLDPPLVGVQEVATHPVASSLPR
jgi:hypothetical protein